MSRNKWRRSFGLGGKRAPHQAASPMPLLFGHRSQAASHGLIWWPTTLADLAASSSASDALQHPGPWGLDRRVCSACMSTSMPATGPCSRCRAARAPRPSRLGGEGLTPQSGLSKDGCKLILLRCRVANGGFPEVWLLEASLTYTVKVRVHAQLP